VLTPFPPARERPSTGSALCARRGRSAPGAWPARGRVRRPRRRPLRRCRSGRDRGLLRRRRLSRSGRGTTVRRPIPLLAEWIALTAQPTRRPRGRIVSPAPLSARRTAPDSHRNATRPPSASRLARTTRTRPRYRPGQGRGRRVRSANPCPCPRRSGYSSTYARTACQQCSSYSWCSGFVAAKCLGLRWEDVDFELGVIRIRRGLHRVGGGLEVYDPRVGVRAEPFRCQALS